MNKVRIRLSRLFWRGLESLRKRQRTTAVRSSYVTVLVERSDFLRFPLSIGRQKQGLKVRCWWWQDHLDNIALDNMLRSRLSQSCIISTPSVSVVIVLVFITSGTGGATPLSMDRCCMLQALQPRRRRRRHRLFRGSVVYGIMLCHDRQ